MKELFYSFLDSCYLIAELDFDDLTRSQKIGKTIPYSSVNPEECEHIYYIYDKQVARQKKLSRILDTKVDLSNVDLLNGEIYFEVDYEKKSFNVDYYKVWSKFEKKLGLTLEDLAEMKSKVSEWIKDDKRFENLKIEAYLREYHLKDLIEDGEIFTIIEE